jgi:transcriptional regulator with XRE-family HTH domain
MTSDWTPIVAHTQLIRRTLATNVRRERERGGLSQEALADASCVPRSTISRLEQAQQEPRLSTLVAIAVALGTPLWTLLVGLPATAGLGGDVVLEPGLAGERIANVSTRVPPSWQ